MKTNTTTFIVVRHGETEWNKIERQQGQLNSNLSELGIKQANAMAEGLKALPIDIFLSSDLGRAIETATIISKAINKAFETDARLRERHLGIMQGLTKQQFSEQYPDEAVKFMADNPDYVLPAGESIRQRHTRNMACFEDLAGKYPGKHILVVAHGGVLMSLIHHVLKIPLDAKRTYSLFNASINVFTVDAKKTWRLELWGDTAHLRAHGITVLDDN